MQKVHLIQVHEAGEIMVTAIDGLDLLLLKMSCLCLGLLDIVASRHITSNGEMFGK